MTMNARSLSLILGLATLLGCGGGDKNFPEPGANPDGGAAQDASSEVWPVRVLRDERGRPTIGSPCTGKDGWQPSSFPPPPLGPEDAHVAEPLDGSAEPDGPETPPPTTDAAPSYMSAAELPPGIGHCLSPGALHPYGSFVSNCGSDEDCPVGAVCDGRLCRAPCTDDSACLPPTRCAGGTAPRRFCTWPESPGLCPAGPASCGFDGENHNSIAVANATRALCPRGLARHMQPTVTFPGEFSGAATIDGQGHVTLLAGNPAAAPATQLRRISPSGQMEWQTALPFGTHVASSATGEVFVAGSFSGTIQVLGSPITASGRFDGAVARVENSGAVAWAVPMTEEGHDLAPMSVVVAPDGTAAVLWRRVVRPTPADFPNPPLIEHASLAKYSATGQPLWQRKLPAQVSGRGLAVDRQGNLIVVAMAEGGDGPDFGAGALPRSDVRRVVLVALSPAGDLTWAKPAGFSPENYNPSAVVSGDDGAVYVAGTAGEQRVFPFGVSYAVDAFVAAFDRQGDPRWERRISDTQQNDVASLTLDPCGNLLLAGTASGRAFVAEFDPEGIPRDFVQIVAPASVHDASNDIGIAQILADPTAGMLVVGSVRGHVSLGGGTLQSASTAEHDTFVARWAP
jgi:outer membrane protein assembly factor BamB